MTSIKKLGAVVGAMALAGIVAGIASNAGASTSEPWSAGEGSTQADGDVQVSVALSFRETCRETWAEGQGNAATFARANACLRRDNTWTGPKVWHGWCTTNLINNDGNIECSSTP
ncbi:hypothetical protein LVJ94_28280 [Pendulispora rubella]|uniref:Uncharacterized protein n=1 Tax=Pendulispora rubella TaxID=2741070 RepID=A0ABZ2KX00_9BACT